MLDLTCSGGYSFRDSSGGTRRSIAILICLTVVVNSKDELNLRSCAVG